MLDKLNATVQGTTCEGEPFTEDLEFSLLRPDPDTPHYGTGCYMRVVLSAGPPQLWDVRYAKTTNLGELASQFIDSWYGKNAEKITYHMNRKENA